MEKIALIMAGGKGQRFWPASRENKPKQFLSIISETSLISQTVERLEGLFKKENIFVITGEMYFNNVIDEITDLPKENVICEPTGMDTANAIGLGAMYIEKRFNDGVVCVLSADHVISPNELFHKTLETGFNIAQNNESLLTIGIVPSRPDTGYGYIQKDSLFESQNGINAFTVKQFKEKPNFEKAQEYVSSGNFLWNSGMFIWKNSHFLKELNHCLPSNYEKLKQIQDFIGKESEKTKLKEIFPTLNKISVDYGILEKCENIICIAGEFDWDDVGSWSSLYRHLERDENNNVIKGKSVLQNSKDCLVYSDDDTLIGLIECDDLMVVKSGNAILVCKKKDDQKIKELLNLAKENNDLKKFL